MKIIDSHIHLKSGILDSIITLADRYNFDKFAMMALPCHYSLYNTLECLILKRMAPDRAYVFGGMTYFPGVEPTAKDHEKQLELMMDAGCDGWKILESKPSIYRRLQLPLDGEVFRNAFAMAERDGIPIKWHAGDPATFWDIEKAPPSAAENGWLCVGEGFPSLEKIYSEVENVMARHPRLKASLAHLYFISDDMPHGERMLRTYENFTLDITPGSEMYEAFLANREKWASFFRRWQDKLIFGTDTYDWTTPDKYPPRDGTFDMIWKTLAGSEQFEESGISGVGLGLDEQIIEKIFAKNFERVTGDTPRPLSESGLNAYAEWLLPKLPAEDRIRAEALLNG